MLSELEQQLLKIKEAYDASIVNIQAVYDGSHKAVNMLQDLHRYAVNGDIDEQVDLAYELQKIIDILEGC